MDKFLTNKNLFILGAFLVVLVVLILIPWQNGVLNTVSDQDNGSAQPPAEIDDSGFRFVADNSSVYNYDKRTVGWKVEPPEEGRILFPEVAIYNLSNISIHKIGSKILAGDINPLLAPEIKELSTKRLRLSIKEWESYKNDIIGYSLLTPSEFDFHTPYYKDPLPGPSQASIVLLKNDDQEIWVTTQPRFHYDNNGIVHDLFDPKIMNSIEKLGRLNDFLVYVTDKWTMAKIGSDDQIITLILKQLDEEMTRALLGSFDFDQPESNMVSNSDVKVSVDLDETEKEAWQHRIFTNNYPDDNTFQMFFPETFEQFRDITTLVDDNAIIRVLPYSMDKIGAGDDLLAFYRKRLNTDAYRLYQVNDNKFIEHLKTARGQRVFIFQNKFSAYYLVFKDMEDELVDKILATLQSHVVEQEALTFVADYKEVEELTGLHTTEEIASWLEFGDETYNFSIKLPEDWRVTQLGDYDKSFFSGNSLAVYSIAQQQNIYEGIPRYPELCYISVQPNEDKVGLQTWLYNNHPYRWPDYHRKPVKQNQIQLTNAEGFEVDERWYGRVLATSLRDRFFINDDRLVFRVGAIEKAPIRYPNVFSVYKQTCKEILNTLSIAHEPPEQLTEASLLGTNDWKLFSHPVTSYSFKHPSEYEVLINEWAGSDGTAYFINLVESGNASSTVLQFMATSPDFIWEGEGNFLFGGGFTESDNIFFLGDSSTRRIYPTHSLVTNRLDALFLNDRSFGHVYDCVFVCVGESNQGVLINFKDKNIPNLSLIGYGSNGLNLDELITIVSSFGFSK
jgi:hypothetical protein